MVNTGVKELGFCCRIIAGEELASRACCPVPDLVTKRDRADGLGGSGYSQIRPMRVQLSHSGSFSEHLTLRRLQVKQPRRDLV